MEDLLPKFYEEVLGRPFPSRKVSNVPLLRSREIETLLEISEKRGADSRLHYELLRELITTQAVSKRSHTRSKLVDELDRVMERSAFTDAEEALCVALSRKGTNQTDDSPASDGLEMPSLFVNITLPEHNDVS